MVHRIVVMGVTSTGKTATGYALSLALGGRFVDGDDLHPAANVEKMARGAPLGDADRWPWLDAVGAALAEGQGTTVIACSALRRAYRDRLRATAPDAAFVWLHGPKDLIARRMAARKGHFMPVSLLDSQLATLEPPGPDERAVPVDISDPLPVLVPRIQAALDGLR